MSTREMHTVSEQSIAAVARVRLTSLLHSPNPCWMVMNTPLRSVLFRFTLLALHLPLSSVRLLALTKGVKLGRTRIESSLHRCSFSACLRKKRGGNREGVRGAMEKVCGSNKGSGSDSTTPHKVLSSF